jgi:RNA polymerase sigma factor (sigma-70 family)
MNIRAIDDARSDEDLAARAGAGDGRALDALLRRHQGWLFHLALRMLQTREDAEDATQEALVKIATRLSSFRGDAAFRTWAYRIMANHLLDRKRSRAEAAVHGFDCYASYLESAPDGDLPAGVASPQERDLLLKEAKLACLMGMLLCLDREQRFAFLLGEVLEVGDVLGGEVLATSAENFRQRVSRARRQLYGFMAGRCGLVDSRNPCRCARKTAAFVRDGIVDPQRLVFVAAHMERARTESAASLTRFESETDALCTHLHRQAELPPSPDFADRLREILTIDRP